MSLSSFLSELSQNDVNASFDELYEQAKKQTKILVADDDQMIRTMLFRLLSSKYSVETVTNGEEALHFISENTKPGPVNTLDYVVTDGYMPHYNGDAVINHAMASGMKVDQLGIYTGNPFDFHHIAQMGVMVLAKPYTFKDVTDPVNLYIEDRLKKRLEELKH